METLTFSWLDAFRILPDIRKERRESGPWKIRHSPDGLCFWTSSPLRVAGYLWADELAVNLDQSRTCSIAVSLSMCRTAFYYYSHFQLLNYYGASWTDFTQPSLVLFLPLFQTRSISLAVVLLLGTGRIRSLNITGGYLILTLPPASTGMCSKHYSSSFTFSCQEIFTILLRPGS